MGLAGRMLKHEASTGQPLFERVKDNKSQIEKLILNGASPMKMHNDLKLTQ
jgi:hypothetical protein